MKKKIRVNELLDKGTAIQSISNIVMKPKLKICGLSTNLEVYMLCYQMLVINYVHGSAELENKTYRLVKSVIIKIKLANPRESYDLRFINVSIFKFIFYQLKTLKINTSMH